MNRSQMANLSAITMATVMLFNDGTRFEIDIVALWRSTIDIIVAITMALFKGGTLLEIAIQS